MKDNGKSTMNEWCISYWTWGMFQCHVRFQGCIYIFSHSFPFFFRKMHAIRKSIPVGSCQESIRPFPKKCPRQVKPLLGAVWTPKPSDFTEPLEKVPWNPKCRGGWECDPAWECRCFEYILVAPENRPSYKDFHLPTTNFQVLVYYVTFREGNMIFMDVMMYLLYFQTPEV